MESINLSAYYDKISSIRAKILTKHREQPAEAAQKYLKDDHSTLNVLNNNHKNRSVQSFDTRAPLKVQTSNQQNINQRLKQLDSVNDKIKLILANKRQSSANLINKHIPITSSKPSKPSLQATPKRITSLFQNQNKIVQSKVGPSIHNFPSSRQKNVEQRFSRSNSIKNTVQSRLCTNQRNQFSRTRQEKTNKYQFLSLKEQKIDRFKVQEVNTKNDNYPLDVLKKRSDLTFADKNRESIECQKPNIQNYQRYVPQIKRSISVSGFHGKIQTKKLIQLLSDQIMLDTKLRQAKEEFNNLKAQNKWSKLKEQISTYCVKVSDEELENWINLSAQESNPFSQKKSNSNFSYPQLASCFIESWRHWNQKLKDSAKIANLEEQGFKIQQIDLGQKGYITIEDLVCFINLNSDSCLRNRDVFCLFKRWNNTNKGEKVDNKLKYETFLSFVAQ